MFYGALSVHLGAFLLLRVSPLLDISVLAERRGRDARSGVGSLRGYGRPGTDRRQKRFWRSPR